LQCTIIISVTEKYLMRSKENAMFSNPEQLSAAAKANVEARLEMINTVTSKAFESLEKVIDLNINTVKSSFEESTAAAKKLLTVTSPQDFFMLATQAQPNLEILLTYGRALADISTRTQAEMLQATRERLASSHDAMSPLLATPIPKKAPAAISSNAAPTPKAATPTVKPEKKAEKPAKVAVEPVVAKPAAKKAPAKAEVKASTAKEKPVAAKSAVKPAAAAVAKAVVPSAAEKPVAAAPAAAPVTAPAAAPAAKIPEQRPVAKPVAATPAAAVAPASKPASLPTKASAATEKNTSKKK
jgi:phasin family protein